MVNIAKTVFRRFHNRHFETCTILHIFLGIQSIVRDILPAQIWAKMGGKFVKKMRMIHPKALSDAQNAQIMHKIHHN